MGWHNVIKFLNQVSDHSTLMSKYWIVSFFLIRMLIIFSIGKAAWGGAQGGFVCNTQSPGCKNVCFNEYSPIALPTYWAVQLLFVALPSIMFLVYTAYKVAHVEKAIAKKRKKEADERAKEKKRLDKAIEKDKQKGILVEAVNDSDIEPPPPPGKIVSSKIVPDVPTKLFLAYFFMVVSRIVIDIAFVIGQYHIYTFKFVMPELWQCQHWPCPNVVDCFVSRPKEKTIFICLFYASCCIMVILSLMEVYHLSDKFPEAWSNRNKDISIDIEDDPSFGHYNYATTAAGFNTGYPDVSGIPTVYPVQRQQQGAGGRHYRNDRALGRSHNRRRRRY